MICNKYGKWSIIHINKRQDIIKSKNDKVFFSKYFVTLKNIKSLNKWKIATKNRHIQFYHVLYFLFKIFANTIVMIGLVVYFLFLHGLLLGYKKSLSLSVVCYLIPEMNLRDFELFKEFWSLKNCDNIKSFIDFLTIIDSCWGSNSGNFITGFLFKLDWNMSEENESLILIGDYVKSIIVGVSL